ncbi:hypothetical protein ACFOVU_03220 [Nocardiopsis sediminis]|uniref:Uncharacterized protein n=1 Tax=Nocardiopsis sediminis TaxID=1778267 RepID=A0ABV8FJE7_9ACTN
MRRAGWVAAIVAGSWVVTLAGYLLTGMAAGDLAPRIPGEEPPSAGAVQTAGVVALLGMVAVVAAAVWLGALLARDSAGMERRGAAVTAATGPLAAVAVTLLLSAILAVPAGTIAVHAGCAIAATGAALYATLRRKR